MMTKVVESRNRPAKSFLFLYLWPRRAQLFWDKNLLVPILISACVLGGIALFGRALPGTPPEIAAVSNFLIVYAGITFGGCVAGATLAVALPGGRALATLAVNGNDGIRKRIRWTEMSEDPLVVREDSAAIVELADFKPGFRSYYNDLIFIFVYSALVQLLLAAVSIVSGFAYGDTPPYGVKTTLSAFVDVGILTLLASYSFMQLLASLRALLDLGVIRDESARGAAVEGDLIRLDP